MLCVCQQLASIVQNVNHSILLLLMQATDSTLCAIKRCSVVFGVTLRLLVINISSSPTINKLCHLLPAISVTTCRAVLRRHRVDNIQPVAALTASSEARYRLRIAISAYPTCIRRSRLGGGYRWNIVMQFCTEKLEWCGGEKILKICLFVSIEFTNMRDRHTDIG